MRDKFADFQIGEDFSTFVFHCLKLSNFSLESKVCFLELVAERFEKDIELFYF